MASPPVKSATRVFQLLELYAERQSPMTVSGVSARLDWPVSSTHALMASLVDTGYFTFCPKSRTYFPAVRLHRLCSWVPEAIFHGRRPHELMHTLRDAFGETVTLSARQGLGMELHDILIGTLPVSMSVKVGDRFPLFASAIGLTALSAMPPDAVSELMASPEAVTVGRLGDPQKVWQQLDEIRQRGNYFVGYDFVVEGLGALAWPLKGGLIPDVFVLAVAGPTGRIREQEDRIAEKAGSIIARFLEDDDQDPVQPSAIYRARKRA